MGEFNKKWFQIVWACLFIVSFSISRIRHSVDAAWAHNAGIELLDRILLCITLVVTVIICVLQGVNYWRQSKRLFYRKWRRWGTSLAVGTAAAVVLVLLVKYIKGESGVIGEEDRRIIVIAFAGAGLIYAVARHKFKHWRRDE